MLLLRASYGVSRSAGIAQTVRNAGVVSPDHVSVSLQHAVRSVESIRIMNLVRVGKEHLVRTQRIVIRPARGLIPARQRKHKPNAVVLRAKARRAACRDQIEPERTA